MQVVLELLPTGPYLKAAITGSTSPPWNAHLKISTLFQPISAVVSVTILSRNIAFSFHLLRSVISMTLKKCWKGVCGWGFTRTRLGELATLPGPLVGWGGGVPSLTPLMSRYRRLWRLISANPFEFFLHTRPWLRSCIFWRSTVDTFRSQPPEIFG